MRRRDFLRAAGSGAALAILPGCTPDSRPDAAGAGFTGWVWVHGGHEYPAGEWRRRFARLRQAGITGLLVGDGDVERLAGAAHAEGLAFHRWFWTLNRSGDVWAQRNHPEWFTLNRKLERSLEYPPYVGYYKWVCPSRAPVRAYLRGLVDALAADPRVDGVHLDYVRHSDVILPRGLWEKYGLEQDRELPEFDYCYCDVCREQFAALDGRDPLEIVDPPADEAWRRFRWDSVTRAVDVLVEAAHRRAKPITAAVFPTPAIARRLVRQAWDEWPIDAVFPMLYHDFYLEDVGWIGDGVREGVAALSGSRRGLNAGLYLPAFKGPDELAGAVELARSAGASGVSFFEMEGLDAHRLAAVGEVLR